MAAVTKIKDLTPNRDDQTVALYSWGGRHIVVSTVDLDAVSASPAVQMAAVLGGYATGGEETMAFYCDENGENWDYAEIVVMNGADSRERAFAALEEADPNPAD
jgi:hypothetical protein